MVTREKGRYGKMKREAFFDRDASHYYCEDGKAVGAYCREQFPEDVAQTLAVADGVCRKYFLFISFCLRPQYEVSLPPAKP